MAGRIVDTTAAAKLSTRQYGAAVFAELGFKSGTLRVHSGANGQVLSWQGFDWYGAGEMGTLSAIDEDDQLQAGSVELGLSGLDATVVSAALNEDYLGRPAKLWFAVLDEEHKLIGEPIGPFSYTMDIMDGVVGPTSAVKLTAQNKLADWARPKERRYTDTDQQQEFPGDLGLEFVSQMVDKELEW